MYQTMRDIAAGRTVEIPTYDYVTHKRSAQNSTTDHNCCLYDTWYGTQIMLYLNHYVLWNIFLFIFYFVQIGSCWFTEVSIECDICRVYFIFGVTFAEFFCVFFCILGVTFAEFISCYVFIFFCVSAVAFHFKLLFFFFINVDFYNWVVQMKIL